MYAPFTMDAQFTLKLGKDYKENLVRSTLESIYRSHDLATAYAGSRLKQRYKQGSFMFGYTALDVRILACRPESVHLIVCVENLNNPTDIKQLEALVNKYHIDIYEGLQRNNITVKESRAVIRVGLLNIPGKVETWQDEIKREFKGKKEKYFIEPIAAILISFFVLRLGMMSSAEQSKELLKTGISVAQVYPGAVIVYFGKFLFQRWGKSLFPN